MADIDMAAYLFEQAWQKEFMLEPITFPASTDRNFVKRGIDCMFVCKMLRK